MKISTPIFVIDFEGSESCGVVEFGVVEICNMQIVNAKTAICAPKKDISKKDALFFGIDTHRASKESSFTEHLEYFALLRKRGIFAAHNAATEKNLLNSYSPIAPSSPDFLNGMRLVNTWSPWLDTMVLAKNVYTNLQSLKLSDVIIFLNLKDKLDALALQHCPPDRRKWHCALYDALASALIITYTASLPSFESMTLEWLAKFSGVKDSGQDRFF